MATSWANVDANFPYMGDIGGEENMPEQLKALLNYMYTLTEELKYTLNNLDATNMTGAFTGGIDDSISKVSGRTDTALGKIEQLSMKSGNHEEQLQELTQSIDAFRQAAQELSQEINMLKAAVRLGESAISIGGDGIEVNITGTVRINGKEIE